MTEKIEDVLNSVIGDDEEEFQDLEEEEIKEYIRTYNNRLILYSE